MPNCLFSLKTAVEQQQSRIQVGPGYWPRQEDGLQGAGDEQQEGVQDALPDVVVGGSEADDQLQEEWSDEDLKISWNVL